MKMVKNQSDLIRFIPLQFATSIRMNPNYSDLGFIKINLDWKFGLDHSEPGLIWIENSVQIGLDSFGLTSGIEAECVRFSRIDF